MLKIKLLKNKFTKIISYSLIFTLLILPFSGCENNKTQSTNTPVSTVDHTGEEKLYNEPEKPAKIIILAGQSNAVGATLKTPLRLKLDDTERYNKMKKGFENVKIAYFAEAGGAEGQEGTFRTNIDFTAEGAQSLDDVFVPTDLTNSWTTSMFGPEIGIAEYLSEKYPDETFYIVKVAKGGISIKDSWENGDYCYEKLTDMMEICCDSLKAEGYTPQLISICWIQGENEGMNKVAAGKYGEYLSDVAERMRTDFAEYAPNGMIPFIDAGISDSPNWKFYKEVNDAKKAFSETSDLNYYFSVIDEGLEYSNEPAKNPDLAHYDCVSVVKLGTLLGEYVDTAYQNLLKK
ncbi:MAG: hypothetical protein IJZ94_00325 [Clostridia bacterium]|nr:hypothetical protein [Clostridia bacterium]